MNDDKLVNRDEAARRVGLPSRTVYALARRGELPAIKVGRVWRFDPRQLDAWLTRREPDCLEEEPERIDVAPLTAEEIAAAEPHDPLGVARLLEQRQTNRLLTRLLNRGSRR